MIIDPAAGTITHLVIEPGHRREARLVPLDLVDAAAGEIRLRCTLAQFERLEHAAERDMVEGLANVGGGLIGMEYGTDLAHRGTVVEDVVPVGETDVGPVSMSMPSMARSGGCRAFSSIRTITR